MTILRICNKVIEYSFYALFFLVPLVLASDTFELFEFNKMWLTFALTIIIGAAWFTKMVFQRRMLIQRTPLDIPIALFLLSQVISTIFSWDQHVSFWGYYSRFNGGLLSMISYIFLYYAFLSNFRNEQVRGDASGGAQAEGRARLLDRRGFQRSASSFAVPLRGTRLEGAPLDERAAGPRAIDAIIMVKRLLFVSLISGLVVALWGLPSHFGYDPTCLLFRGTFDVSCWTADFQPKVRIFSTLGQPDWLAAYLAILIPISIALGIKNSKHEAASDAANARNSNLFRVSNFGFWIFLLLSALFYLALLYTGARSGILATWLSLAFFFIFYIWFQRKQILRYWYVLVVFVVLVFITFFVGQPFPQLDKLTLKGLIQKPTETTVPNRTTADQTIVHAGEFGGTDSSKIRKIVWQGAIDVWKNYPIFGTGVETFAFAYYRFRPPEHNLTSEWNFLYNKAHNEFLNYLATTGAVGLGSYILMIGWFIFLIIKKISKSEFLISKEVPSSKSQLGQLEIRSIRNLILALLASYLSILVTNFFGFSVVITNIYLFMIPAFVFILGGMTRGESVRQPTDRISPYQWTFIFFIILTSAFLILNLFRYWNADKAYGLGYNLDRAGEYQQAYPNLQKALGLRDGEPVFKDELAINNAILAEALLAQKDAKAASDSAALAGKLAQDAITLNTLITSEHPNNIIFWKSRVRIFYALAQVDPRYFSFALEAIKKAKELAPTDANVSYNLGVLYGQNGDVKKGTETLEKTIKLKPDYRDAYFALGLFYRDQAVDKEGKVLNQEAEEKAVAQMKFIFTHISKDDTAVKETLKSWGL